jgi:hypothetical protein
MFEGLAFEQLHDEEGPALVLADVIYGADVGMIESGSSAGFALEAFDGQAIGGHVFWKKLESDEAVEARVLGFVDDAHAAPAEFFYDAIMRNGAAKERVCSGHGAAMLNAGMWGVNEGGRRFAAVNDEDGLIVNVVGFKSFLV